MAQPRKVLAFAVLGIVSLPLLAVVPSYRVGGAAPDASLAADVVYRSTTGPNGTSAPNLRSGISSWTAPSVEPDSGSPILAVQIAQSPRSTNERIFVTQGDDGWLDAYICATPCSVTSDVGQVWGTAPGTFQRRFDVAYEQHSGDALLVYGVLSTNGTEDLAYRTYGGGAWSAERFLDDSGHSSNLQYSLISLASRKGSDQIGLLAGESTNNHVNAWIWDGASFGSHAEITANAQSPNRERAAIAWESSSGHLLAMAVDAGAQDEIVWREYTTGWSPPSNQACGGAGNTLRWLSLRPNPSPTANDMVLAAGDDGSDLGTCYWTGSSWGARTPQDPSIDASASRAFDFAWGASGNAGILAYGTTAGQITYRTFIAPGSWGNATEVAMGANAHAWVQLRTNPSPSADAPKVLGAILESSANALGAVAWNNTGLAVLGAEIFTSDMGSAAYESFDLEFRVAGTSGGGLGDILKFLMDPMVLVVLGFVAVAAILLAAARSRRRRRRTPTPPPSYPAPDPGSGPPPDPVVDPPPPEDETQIY